MLKYLKSEANKTFTENGAVTYSTTFSDCLDLFATSGALRHAFDLEIEDRFMRAYTENRNLAMKILFFTRDVRGGLGERRVFRVALRWLAENHPDSVRKNIGYIAEYGRFDDLLVLLGTPLEDDAVDCIKTQLEKDANALKNSGEVSLLAKWLPSVNASNPAAVLLAKKLARKLGMDEAVYRKTLSRLRAEIRIIENNLRKKDYTFDYSKQPSKAMFKYKKAFMRNDSDRYMEFLDGAKNGEKKLNTSTLAPYELVEQCLEYDLFSDSYMKKLTEEEKKALNVTWANLPDFGGNSNSLAVIDTSGSMYCQSSPIPASVALSLGMYFAERNKGSYGNHFIEFSETPQLIEIKGETFVDKLEYLSSFNEIANTNLEAVFDLILETAVKYKLDAEQLPERLIIISDMEFDCCVENSDMTNFENAKAKFNAHGYDLPAIVFWNVASRHRQQPVTQNEEGVCLVSGCTPRLFSMVASGDIVNLTPMDFMMEVLNGERYSPIAG